MGERFWYQTREIHLTVRNLPQAFKGWKVVQISDIHLGFHYDAEDLRKVITMINQLGPDILLFTGDLVQTGYRPSEEAVSLLRELKAPRGGKWAVLGNHDYMTRDKVIMALQSGQFEVLINSHGYMEIDRQRLYIAGIDDVMYGDYNIPKALQGLSEQNCILFLAHEPDIVELSCKYGISAQFSGHSHGGQIRLPLIGPLISNDFAKKYDDGLYFIGELNMPLYVNRGIGTTNLPVRLFCRPEITVFYLT